MFTLHCNFHLLKFKMTCTLPKKKKNCLIKRDQNKTYWELNQSQGNQSLNFNIRDYGIKYLKQKNKDILRRENIKKGLRGHPWTNCKYNLGLRKS